MPKMIKIGEVRVLNHFDLSWTEPTDEIARFRSLDCFSETSKVSECYLFSDDGLHKRLISENGSPHMARPTKVELFRGDILSGSPSSPMTPSQNYRSRTNKGNVRILENLSPPLF